MQYLEAFEGEEERVAHRLDVLQRLLFLLGVQAEAAKDDLEGLGNVAGGRNPPDLPVAAGAKALDHAVARNRLSTRTDRIGHDDVPSPLTERSA